MYNSELRITLEQKDKYKKAKQDLIQALKSCGELTPQQNECLMQELFGAANVALAYCIYNHIIWRGDII